MAGLWVSLGVALSLTVRRFYAINSVSFLPTGRPKTVAMPTPSLD